MPSNFVENPELNKLYLLKRNKSGSAAKRAQPGTIVEIKRVDGHSAPYAKVHWLYDGVFEDNVLMFYGFAKDLTRKWVDMEAKRLHVELLAAKRALHTIEQLQFNPAQMTKVSA